MENADGTAATQQNAIRKSILTEASEVIYGDREKTYGHPAKNLELIATYWAAHLGIPVGIDDVCIMMVLLKQARLKNQPSHRDSQVDTCGYMALMERCQDYERSNSNQAGKAKD